MSCYLWAYVEYQLSTIFDWTILPIKSKKKIIISKKFSKKNQNPHKNVALSII